MDRNIKKAIFIIMGCSILILLCILPFLLVDEEKQVKEYLPEYQKIEIDEKTEKNTEKKTTTRKDLEKNEYFIKFATSPDYNYTNVSKNQIEDGYLNNMIKNYIYNFELKNTKAIYSINKDTETFCINESKVKEGFEELYYFSNGFDSFMKYIPAYIEYISKDGDRLCFNYGNKYMSNDGESLIGIDSISVSDKNNITATVYLYNFYTTNTSKEQTLVNAVKNYISKSKYADAKKIVENNLNGTVIHKKIVFRMNRKPKYFPFKLLYSFKID